MNGILTASYRFLPKEYLDGDAQGLELMPVGTPVQSSAPSPTLARKR